MHKRELPQKAQKAQKEFSEVFVCSFVRFGGE
jgi:hypothetical protein